MSSTSQNQKNKKRSHKDAPGDQEKGSKRPQGHPIAHMQALPDFQSNEEAAQFASCLQPEVAYTFIEHLLRMMQQVDPDQISSLEHSRPVSPSSHLPQPVAGPSQTRGDLPPDPLPEPESEESASEEGVLESESEGSDRPTSPTVLASMSAVPDSNQRRDTTAASAPTASSVPPTPIMSSPSTAPDKETLKLLPLRYDGKTVIECDRFLSQLRIYWLVNTSLTTIELKVQVALSLLDRDAHAWATPYFSQLASVQMGVQGVMTPFRNEAAFTAAFKACFGNLDDEAAAQVELAKLCANKSVREKCTAAEFSALFKGPADRSGYGDLELRDKYLSGIPSRVYRKIELETFTTWQEAEKRATEVEQILDISRARRPELNNFFSAQGRGCGGARGGAPHTPSFSQHQCGRRKRKLRGQLLRLWEAGVPTLRVPQL
ncbi:predicted protein [Postia placenta Mad-698-R]|uniref:Retrotransposon gag domain-containing protein n=1 Tax=Postia placenta MAD-698-R-SB12 TaxID=670580 RepID=A0A1X6MNK4_9APHY|nr:hypothetical protein POSPLADRAFT_1155717 [Postia placenta MAD-698-R-SB12]EED79839.1 predicted protein [Postia placenta Mad-698-R]OSX57683.1 hypothetical protein POSPLADRAFT_1155717 [Postia placenta MAD-698-R-SB12]